MQLMEKRTLFINSCHVWISNKRIKKVFSKGLTYIRRRATCSFLQTLWWQLYCTITKKIILREAAQSPSLGFRIGWQQELLYNTYPCQAVRANRNKKYQYHYYRVAAPLSVRGLNADTEQLRPWFTQRMKESKRAIRPASVPSLACRTCYKCFVWISVFEGSKCL